MATNTYIGPQGGDPSDPANWSLDAVPKAGDVVDVSGYAGVPGGAAELDLGGGVFAGSTIDISQKNADSVLYQSSGAYYFLDPAVIAESLGSAAAPVDIDVTADNGTNSIAGLLLGTLDGSIDVAARQSLLLGTLLGVSGREVEIDGTVTIGAGATLSTESFSYAGFLDLPSVTFDHNVLVDGGRLVLQAIDVSGAGTLTIADGGTILADPYFGENISTAVSFDATGGTLVVDQLGVDVTGTISGFGAGDAIFAYDESRGTYPVLGESYADNVLTVQYYIGEDIFTFAGDYELANFKLTQVDGAIEITYQPCFAAGTAIATPDGPREVETIAAGDHVVLAEGGAACVIWVGHRRARATRLVRFRPGSLGAGTPLRDLVTSDDHAMLIDDVLVPAGLLVNGATILAERGDATLFHLELEHHAVLLAEGAPAESYLDTGNRAQFGNCPMQYDPVQALGEPCAELLLAGPRLDAIHARLAALAAPVLA